MNERPSIRALLVEDDPTDAWWLEEELRHVHGADFILARAERLEDALACLAGADFDVVLLDLGLPDSQGPHTLIRLREHCSEVPIVVLTGVDDEGAGLRALQLGAQDYLVKGQLPAPLLGRSLRYAIERHHSALALRQSEARLSSLISSAMDAIITVDDQQRITVFNPAAEQTFGRNASEVLGKTLDRLIPDRFRSAQVRQPRLFGQIDMTPWKMGELGLIYGLRADGREFPMEASIAQVEGVGQKLFTVILRDITERKRAEEALSRSQRVLAHAEQLAQVGAWESELSNREELEKNPLHWSDATCRIFGYEPGATEVSHELFMHHVAEEDRPRVRDAFRQAIASRAPYSVEHRLVRNDGAERTVIEHAEVLLDKSGLPARVIGATQDITERKRAEAALQLRTHALEAAANGIVITNRQGTIIWANAAVTALTGYTTHELVGNNPRILKSNQHSEAFYRDLWAAVLSGQVWHGELINRRKDGSLYTEEMTITPVRDATGEITWFIGIKQDITRRKQAESELRAALDRLEVEVAERKRAEAEVMALSHQLITAQEEERTRLARDLHDDVSQQIAVLGIGLSKIKRHIPQKQKEGHEEAQRAFQRLTQLSEDIRRLSHQLHPTMLGYSGLEAALKSYCAEFKQVAGVEASVQAQGGVDDLPSQPALGVLRITQEALQNVWKHSGTKQVSIDLERSGQEVRLRISDNGCGFDSAQGGEGKGLGLVSMRERARLMGGTLAIESVKGRGTTIIATIPLVAVQAAPRRTPKPREAGPAG